jgi:N-glycosylase/DNA lyase
MHEVVVPRDQPFDLDLTLGCGQAFRWAKQGEWWRGVAGGRRVHLKQDGSVIKVQGAEPDWVIHYLHLDADLPAIVDAIDRDPTIHTALSAYTGLRVIRQEPFEVLASYICATYSNIPGITKKIQLLSERFGEERVDEWGTFHSFPGPGELSSGGVCTLRDCRLGYRAPYIAGTSQAVMNDAKWAEKIRLMPYEQAFQTLLALPGVGAKVADCTLLFGFQEYRAFPVDVWIHRIIAKHYFPGHLKVREREVREFGRRHFGNYAGYAQEYLYAARRLLTPKTEISGDENSAKKKRREKMSGPG